MIQLQTAVIAIAMSIAWLVLVYTIYTLVEIGLNAWNRLVKKGGEK